MFDFFKKKKPETQTESVIVTLEADDTTVKAFQIKAQQELWYLIEFMGAHAKDDELFRYAVKTKFTENGKSEHMWVHVNEFKDDYFLGKLVNKPSTMRLIKYGDTTKVHKDDVEDWLLQDFLTNTHVGKFSSEYIRNSK